MSDDNEALLLSQCESVVFNLVLKNEVNKVLHKQIKKCFKSFFFFGCLMSALFVMSNVCNWDSIWRSWDSCSSFLVL